MINRRTCAGVSSGVLRRWGHFNGSESNIGEGVVTGGAANVVQTHMWGDRARFELKLNVANRGRLALVPHTLYSYNTCTYIHVHAHMHTCTHVA